MENQITSREAAAWKDNAPVTVEVLADRADCRLGELENGISSLTVCCAPADADKIRHSALLNAGFNVYKLSPNAYACSFSNVSCAAKSLNAFSGG